MKLGHDVEALGFILAANGRHYSTTAVGVLGGTRPQPSSWTENTFRLVQIRTVDVLMLNYSHFTKSFMWLEDRTAKEQIPGLDFVALKPSFCSNILV